MQPLGKRTIVPLPLGGHHDCPTPIPQDAAHAPDLGRKFQKHATDSDLFQ